VKPLIFSDTHFTTRFNPKLFDKLSQLIKQVDHVIINGDLWDGELINFDQFLVSPWKKLFPLLKAKHTVYIYGNHDKESWCDKRVSSFSDIQANHYLLRVNDKELYITHGHQVVKYLNFVHYLADKYRPVNFLARIGIQTSMSIFGERHMQLYKDMNKRMKDWAQKRLASNQILVCGHSHLAEYAPEKQFIDLGCNCNGFFVHLLIEGSQMHLVKSRY
jgi:predicted phosphodiesterase